MKSPFGKHTALVWLATAFLFTAILMRIFLADIVMELAACIPVAIIVAGVWLLKKSVPVWKSTRAAALTATAITLLGLYFHILESEESINEIHFWLLKPQYEQRLIAINEEIASGKAPSDSRLDTAFAVEVGPPIRVVFSLRGELFWERAYGVANDPTGKILRANEPENGGHIAPVRSSRMHFESARHLTGDWYLCAYRNPGEG